ncbi:hypothetical protein EON62_02270 [archaeon]|nr:MAG: hypothetical protein EON62_02270 [archaeon]
MSVFEKRSLMKFLQFANDLRIEEVQKQDVARLNDQLLGAGRSLAASTSGAASSADPPTAGSPAGPTSGR